MVLSYFWWHKDINIYVTQIRFILYETFHPLLKTFYLFFLPDHLVYILEYKLIPVILCRNRNEFYLIDFHSQYH